MAKGFGGMPGNMQAMMKQAQKMQQDLLKAQQAAELLTSEGSAGGGMVKVIVNGKNEIESLEIQKEAVDPEDVEMLQDMIVAACNQALQDVQEQSKAAINKVTGGMNIPGL